MQLEAVLLNETIDVSQFNCGEEKLNVYLKDFALLYQQRHFGVTLVFFDKHDIHKKIMGYYTICPACIERKFLPQKTLTGPQPNPIPAFRICRLAVDQFFQGKGLGKLIFLHALHKCLLQANQIGGSIILIDAKSDETKIFYEKFGFSSIPDHSLILYQTVKYIQKHFS